MKSECIDAVNQAAGKQFTEQQIADIERRIGRELRFMGKEAVGMGHAQRYQEAAKRAAQSFLAEQDLKAKRDHLAVLKHGQIEDALDTFKGDKINGLRHLLAFHADGKGSVMSVESRTAAIEADMFRQMIGTIEATNPKFFGLFESKAGVRDLVRELFGEDTGNADAKAGAEQFHAVAQQALSRFNDAGGKIREREDWALPYHHSQSRVAAAGADAWTARVFPMLKREAYFNEDGSRMNDAQAMDFLRNVYVTLSTGGVNRLEPGQDGRMMRANFHAAAREVHFKDAQTYMDYQADFGERSLYDVLTGHIKGLADSIGMVETFGPNPEQAYKTFRDQAYQEAVLLHPERHGKITRDIIRLDNLFNYVSGNTLPVASEWLANGFDSLRKWLVASRLGSAFISSLPDEATMQLTAHVNKLPAMQLLRNELASLNPANQVEKRLANRAGLALNTMIGYLNRFGDESMKNNAASKASGLVMRASGLNAITEARRRAFGTTMMSAIGQLTRDYKKLEALDHMDRRILLSKGITDADFKVWKLAELEDWQHGNDTMLTPESIYRIPDEKLAGIAGPEVTPAQIRRDAATRLLGAVLEETNMAVVEPGARERAMLYGNLQRGTWKGELMRSVWLFKTMPIAMLLRHWERGLAMPDARSKAGYIAAMVASTTVLGMAALQVDELLKGRDPVNMNPFEGKAGGRNWARAMLKGGSLGIYGDFLFSPTGQSGAGPVASALGPLVGMGEEAFGLTQGNLLQLARGEKTHAGAELIKFAKGMTPGANLWYTKAVTDHLIFNQLQEMASPGYLARVRSRAQREFGQTFYWDPARKTPDRAPNPAAAVSVN